MHQLINLSICASTSSPQPPSAESVSDQLCCNRNGYGRFLVTPPLTIRHSSAILSLMRMITGTALQLHWDIISLMEVSSHRRKTGSHAVLTTMVNQSPHTGQFPRDFVKFIHQSTYASYSTQSIRSISTSWKKPRSEILFKSFLKCD